MVIGRVITQKKTSNVAINDIQKHNNASNCNDGNKNYINIDDNYCNDNLNSYRDNNTDYINN